MTAPGNNSNPAAPGAQPSIGHLPGLDGLRALAVSAVVVYHADMAALPGGFLGVDLFFVLSGFLISALLAAEFERSGRVDYGQFYLRRARRLLPALFALLLTLAALVPWFLPDAVASLRADALAALAYVSNWWFVWSGTSYFDSLGRPPLLQHLWSLAIEEQFYLCWPFLMVWALRRGGRGAVAWLSLLLAGLSTGWMAWLAMRANLPANGDPSRLHFGTDTHAMGLFIGAACAMWWQPLRATMTASRTVRIGWDLAGLGALCLLGAAFLSVEEREPLLFRGGYLMVAVVCGVLVASACQQRGLLTRALSVSPLRWLGERSYALYLWHWPILVGLRPGHEIALAPVPALAVQLALTLLCADLSYRWVERPIRHGALRRLARGWQRGQPALRGRLMLRAAPATAAGLVMGALALQGTFLAPAAITKGPREDVALALGIVPGQPLPIARVEPKALPLPSTPTRPAVSAPRLPQASLPAHPAAFAPSPLASAELEPLVDAPTPSHGVPAERTEIGLRHGSGLTAVGDSVLLGARHALQRAVVDAQTDAEVGRQAAVLLSRLQGLREARLLTDRVVVHLGTNGQVTEALLRATLETLQDRSRVVVVNAVAPRRWVAGNNQLLDRVLPDYPNAVLADWAGVAEGHPEFFVSDGIHLSSSGQRAFVAEILRALSAPTARHASPARPAQALGTQAGAAASASVEPAAESPSRVF